jgi:uncharacterized membrane protein
MTHAETHFSTLRLEMLCDGIFAIAMTLLLSVFATQMAIVAIGKRTEKAQAAREPAG